MTVVCASRTDSEARQGCRALQVFAYANGFYLRLPRAINRPRNDRNATPFVIAKPVRTLAVAISNHPICTNLFVSSVCRFAERHAGSSCPTNSRTHPRRRARPLGAPVQELPNAYKLIRLYCPPLTRNGWGMPHPYNRLSFLLRGGGNLPRGAGTPDRIRRARRLGTPVQALPQNP